MRETNQRKGAWLVLASAAFVAIAPGIASSQVYKLPVPAECSSSQKLALPRDNHPDNFKSYGKVDLYCGGTVIATGATLCDSDYVQLGHPSKTVNIAVSTAAKTGKVAKCPAGTDLKIVPQ